MFKMVEISMEKLRNMKDIKKTTSSRNEKYNV